MSFKLSSLRKAALQRGSAPGLPLFKFEKLESKELILDMDLLGLYIKVYITVRLFTVVAKQLRGDRVTRGRRLLY